MKIGKAIRKDEISAEMLKAAGNVAIRWLTRLFNFCYVRVDIPEEWD